MHVLLQAVQIAVALIPIVGLVVLAANRMSCAKSIAMGTIIQVIGPALIPGYVILGLQGLFASPVVTGFMGIVTGYVLANLVASD